MNVLEHLPVGGDSEVLHPKVDTDGAAGAAEFPEFAWILEIDKDGQLVLPRLGFRQGRRTNPVLVAPQPPERQVRAPEPQVPERVGEGDVPCVESVGFRDCIKGERDSVHVLLGLEFRESGLMLEEIVIRRDEVAYGLFDYFRVRILQPRCVRILAHHRMVMTRQVEEGEAIPVLVVLLDFQVEESVVDIPRTTEQTVDCFRLFHVRIYPYLNCSQHVISFPCKSSEDRINITD